MLEVRALNTFYGGAHILHDVALSLSGNEVLALLGRNGAGKSTTIKSIMGLVRPRSGSVRYAGTELAGAPAYRICRLGSGYVPEERRVFSELTTCHGAQSRSVRAIISRTATAYSGRFSRFRQSSSVIL